MAVRISEMNLRTALGNVEMASSSDAVALKVNCCIIVGTFFNIDLKYTICGIGGIYRQALVFLGIWQDKVLHMQSKVPKTAYRAF